MPRPRHVGIVMDGNGRWARNRNQPRAFGHRAGVAAVRQVVAASAERGIPALTLFAFSSENWQRPATEVSALFDLMLKAMRKEARELVAAGVRLRFVGDRAPLAADLCDAMADCEAMTAGGNRLLLHVAVNYGGRMELVLAARALARQALAGEITLDQIDEARLEAATLLADAPPLDLFIRTGGERRVSNFLLWQLAYAELYFTPTLWPDFGPADLDLALADYAARERRFGRVGASPVEAP